MNSQYLVAVLVLPDNRAIKNVEGYKQGGCAIAFGVEGISPLLSLRIPEEEAVTKYLEDSRLREALSEVLHAALDDRCLPLTW